MLSFLLRPKHLYSALQTDFVYIMWVGYLNSGREGMGFFLYASKGLLWRTKIGKCTWPNVLHNLWKFNCVLVCFTEKVRKYFTDYVIEFFVQITMFPTYLDWEQCFILHFFSCDLRWFCFNQMQEIQMRLWKKCSISANEFGICHVHENDMQVILINVQTLCNPLALKLRYPVLKKLAVCSRKWMFNFIVILLTF